MTIQQKIPKVIHYCWFGKGEKPKIVKKCINSWVTNLPEYKIIEWNEDNFNINDNNFIKEAYKCKKFAFVSDYVRVYVLYNYGGIYLDTDVEVLQPLDRFLFHDSFWGFEEGNYIATSTIGAEKENKLIKKFLDYYIDKEFVLKNGQVNFSTNVKIVTEIFEELGFSIKGENQNIEGLGSIYQKEFFSPYDYINCIDNTSKESCTIHHFYRSWLPASERAKQILKKALVKSIGVNNLKKLRVLKNRI